MIMHSYRLDLRFLTVGSVVGIAAVGAAWLLMEGSRLAGLSAQAGEYLLLALAVLACCLVVAWAAHRLYEGRSEAKSTELRFRSLLEATPEAIVITGRDSRIMLLNARAEELFGYCREELQQKGLEVLLRPRARTAGV